MFQVEMLPARHGDCLWVEYGPKDKPYRILVDGGTTGTFAALQDKLLALKPADRVIQLFVVTHIDDDHIAGTLALLEKLQALEVTIEDVWFNAYPHLEGKAIASGPDLLGARQGEKLSGLIVDRGLHWNRHFRGRAVVCEEEGQLPVIHLPGGMRLTLLSPYREQLEKLKGAWEKECRKAHILPGEVVEDQVDDTLGEDSDVEALANTPFDPDNAPANGSSIAFLASYRGARVLFGADAYAPVLARSLERLGYTPDKRLHAAAVKAPHHGSTHNVSRELAQLLHADRWLISSNGDKFRHPDRAAIARMLVFNAGASAFHFNYQTDITKFWAAPSRQLKYGYEAVYPPETAEGLVVRLQ